MMIASPHSDLRARIENSGSTVRVVIEYADGQVFQGTVGQTVLTFCRASSRQAQWYCRAVIDGTWRRMPAYFAE